MPEPLRELKCESATGFCTMNPACALFDLFDALGKNSQLAIISAEREGRFNGYVGGKARKIQSCASRN